MTPPPSQSPLRDAPAGVVAELNRHFASSPVAATVVKENRKRTVLALAQTDGDPPLLFLKLDHPVRLVDHLKSRVSPKVKREYDALCALRDAGVPCVEPLACGSDGGRGYLLTRALPGAVEARALWDACQHEPARRAAFLAGLAALVRILVSARVWHPDLHLGNLLVQEQPDGRCLFHLVDAHGVRVLGSLEPAQRDALLGVLAFRPDAILAAEGAAMLLQVLPDLPAADAPRLWLRLHDQMADEVAKRWAGRRRKLLTDSTLCVLHQTEVGTWRLAPDTAPALAQAIVAAHDTLSATRPDALLKNSRKREVSKVEVDGVTYIVKKFRRPGPWGRWAADQRSWLAHRRLEMMRLPVPHTLGWLRRGDGPGYLIMAFIPGEQLRQALRDAPPERQHAILDAAVDLIDRLHARRIVHEDLKLNNLILRSAADAAIDLVLVDNDAVLFDRRIDGDAIARNRRHLVGSVPDLPGLADYAAARYDAVTGSRSADAPV